MAEEIIVDILTDGTVKMEGKGFHGKQCEIVMAEIEATLGKVANVRVKPEYNEKVAHGEKIRGR